MTTRPATPQDAPALATLHMAARKASMPWLPILHTHDDTAAYFRDTVIPSDNVQIAEISGTPAGFIAISTDWINHLYVSPAHWHAGLGSRLLLDAMKDASTLQLWTFQQNAGARAFYAKQNFKEVELTDGARNEEQTPDVRMVWHRKR